MKAMHRQTKAEGVGGRLASKSGTIIPLANGRVRYDATVAVARMANQGHSRLEKPAT